MAPLATLSPLFKSGEGDCSNDTDTRESCCHGSMSHTGSAPSVHHSELTHCTADWTAGKRASVFPGHPTANGFDSDHSIPHDPDEDSPTAASNRHTATLKPTCKTEEPTEQINRQQPGTSSREPVDCRQPPVDELTTFARGGDSIHRLGEFAFVQRLMVQAGVLPPGGVLTGHIYSPHSGMTAHEFVALVYPPGPEVPAPADPRGRVLHHSQVGQPSP